MNEKNLFTIGEVAKSIGITRRIILNYEDKGLIFPDKKDGVNGNRYYTIDTLTTIRTIRAFQDLGMSLDEIRTYFEEPSHLEPIILRFESMRDQLNLAIEKLKERSRAESEEIKEAVIESLTYYVKTHTTNSLAERVSLLRETTLEAMKTYGTDSTKRMLFTENTSDDSKQVDYCVIVPASSTGEHIRISPASKAIYFFYHGPYERMPEAREKLIHYAKEHNLQLTGRFRHVYLEGPPQHKDKNRFITQIIAFIN